MIGTGRRSCHTATLSTTNLTWSDLGLKSGLRDDSRRPTAWARPRPHKIFVNSFCVLTQIWTGHLTNTNRNVSVICHCVDTVQPGTWFPRFRGTCGVRLGEQKWAAGPMHMWRGGDISIHPNRLQPSQQPSLRNRTNCCTTMITWHDSVHSTRGDVNGAMRNCAMFLQEAHIATTRKNAVHPPEHRNTTRLVHIRPWELPSRLGEAASNSDIRASLHDGLVWRAAWQEVQIHSLFISALHWVQWSASRLGRSNPVRTDYEVG